MKLITTFNAYRDRLLAEAAPAVSFPATRSPLEILQAAYAAIKMRGQFHPSASSQSTKGVVVGILWGQLINPADEPEFEKMRLLMADPQVQQQAQAVLTWFSSIPKAEVDSNEFLRSARDIVGRGGINSRQAGFIVGLIPGFMKSGHTTKLTTRSFEWPQEWGEVKMLWKEPVKIIHASYRDGSLRGVGHTGGPYYVLTIELADGHTFAINSNIQQAPKIGTTAKLTCALEPMESQKFNTTIIRCEIDRKWKRDLNKQLGATEDAVDAPD